MNTKIKQHLPCKAGCGSSDAFAVYKDNDAKYFGVCYSCGKSVQLSKDEIEKYTMTEFTKPARPSSLVQGSPPTKPYRGIPLSVLQKFGVQFRTDGYSNNQSVIYPLFCRETQSLVAQKIRNGTGAGKTFSTNVSETWTGKSSDLPFFGSHLFPAGGKRITVTEGEDDCMAHYTMMGGDWPVVSLNFGAGSGKKISEEMFNYLNSFEQIVLSFDNDDAGKDAIEQFSLIFPLKARVLEIPKKDGVKDAVDCLNKGLSAEYKSAYFSAQRYTPEDIVFSSSLIDYIVNRERPNPVPYPFEPLNKLLYGMHQPEVILVTAETKGGKSLFTGVLQNHLFETTDALIADISIEDMPGRRAETLLSLRIRKPLHIPEVRDAILKDNKEYLETSAKEMFEDDRIVFYKNFGVSDTDEILTKLQYFVKVLGCRYLVFDHISYAASYHNGDERKNLDRLSNQLAALATTTGICLIVVAHENRQGEVHGSSNIQKTCFSHIRLSRFRDHPSEEAKSLTKVHVKLNRLYGREGYFYMRYSEDPFGFTVVPTEEAEEILGIKDNV